jgi:TonB family protein
MTNTPVYASNSASLTERRAYLRHHLNALAYIDIGTDNGGIVLNLSEDGMGFQAVGPLAGEHEVSLRIQLPHSQERIETAANIVWLSESNRQAGVQFLNMPAAASAHIREWIRSQMPHDATTLGVVEPLAPHEIPKEPSLKSEPIQQTRIDKWLSLMADLQVPAPEDEKSQPLTSTSTTITLRELSSRLQASETAPQQNTAELAKLPSAPIPPLPAPEQVTHNVSRDEPPQPALPDQPELGDLSRSIADHTTKSTLPAIRTTVPRSTLAVPSQLLPSVKYSAPLAVPPEPKVNSALAVPKSTAPVAPVLAPPAKNSNLKLVAAAAAFVLFSALCFAVGAWVGSLGMPAPEAPSKASVNAGPTTTSGSGEAANPATSASAPATAEPHATHVSANPARDHHNPRLSASANNSAVMAVRQNLPLPSSKQNLPALQTPPTQPAPSTAMNAPPRTAASAPITSATKPPEKGISSPSTSVPVLDNDAPAAPKIVAGHVLRPTDRFIPCHLTYRVEPVYPDEAKRNGIEGTVKLHLSVTSDGSVRDIKLVSGPPLLALAALDAAQYWRYMPALLNGQPIETEQDIEITFRLPH